MRRTPLSLLFSLCLLRAVAQYPVIDRLELAFAQGAADSVMDQLGCLLKDPRSSPDLRYEACMLMAECYYQRSSMERFSAWNDNAAACIIGDTQQAWARVEVNRCRYANYFVKPEQAIRWGEKARSRYQHAGDRPQWKHAYAIYQALGTTHRNIHHDPAILFHYYDTAQVLLAHRKDVIPYWSAMLHKAISNAAMDRTMSGLYDPKPYIPLCDREQLAALRILEKHHPTQLGERCILQNLRALHHVYRHRPDSALEWLQRTETLIGTTEGTERNEAISTAWFDLLRYRSFVYDQPPWHNDTVLLRSYLAQLMAAQRRFTEHMAHRASANGLFFDDTYWLSPYITIVTTCARLWELTGDTTYIDQALWATEKSRRDAWNTAQAVRGHDSLILPDPPTDMLRRVQQRLHPDEAVLVCVHNSLAGIKDWVFTFVITPHGVALNSWVTGFLLRNNSAIDRIDQATYRRVYHTLYDRIYAPVAPMLRDAKRVRVFPSGDISFIAFDALLSDTVSHDIRACGPLARKHAFSYPLLLLPPPETPVQAQGQDFYIAPAPGSGSLTDLQRMRGAMRQWATHGIIDSSFTKSRFDKVFSNAERIYLAGHCAGGYQRDQQPKHYFDTDTAGPSFQPSDLLPLELQADLVVHLACQSGLFDADRNGGAISFSRAFLFAGARNVVSSQYLADEGSSIKLIGLFRDELAKGLPEDVAMQRAKLAYLEQCRTPEEMIPIRWAGWQVLGEPDALEKTPRWHWGWLIAGAIVGLGGLAWYLRRA